MDDDLLAVAQDLAATLSRHESTDRVELIREQLSRAGDEEGLQVLEALRRSPDDQRIVHQLAQALGRVWPEGLAVTASERVRRSQGVRALLGTSDRIFVDAPRSKAFELLVRAALRVGVVEHVDSDALQLEVMVNRGDGHFWVLVTLHASGDATEASFLVHELEYGDEISPGSFMVGFLEAIVEFAAAEPPVDTELPLAAYVDTDDEATFRAVVKHVGALAAHLGFGRPVRVG